MEFCFPMISIDHHFHRHSVIGNMPIVIEPSVIISYSALTTMLIMAQCQVLINNRAGMATVKFPNERIYFSVDLSLTIIP